MLKMALARLFGLVMVAVIITFTTAQNATTSIPGSVQGYYKVPNNDACKFIVHLYILQENYLIYNNRVYNFLYGI